MDFLVDGKGKKYFIVIEHFEKIGEYFFSILLILFFIKGAQHGSDDNFEMFLDRIADKITVSN